MIKKIRRNWLPVALEALAPWFANFTMKFEEYLPTLGLSADDLKQLKEDNAMISWLAEAQAVAEANLVGFRNFRDEALYNQSGSPTPMTPPTALPPQPAPLTTEIIERLVRLVERIQMANAYTEGIGAALGISAPGGGEVPPDAVKPTIQLFPAQSNYETAVVVAGRGNSDMFNVQSRTMSSDSWTTVKSGTGKSLNVTLNPTTPGQPEKFLVRVQLLRKNQNYGQPSDPAYVTVAP